MTFSLVSVVIPARNEERNVAEAVAAVLAQRVDGVDVEVLVVDDGSTDATARRAVEAGARVLTLEPEDGGNPAAARNRGADASRGDPIVFLDAKCRPRDSWLEKLLAAHARFEAEVVGGSLALPDGLSWTAQCDYFCGCYHVHPRRPAGYVTQHPPGNLSVRREPFLATSGFNETHPIAYSHEELRWQAELIARGGRIYFEPEARVDHFNRTGLGNLLRRNYRWGYSAIQSKANLRVTRFSWLYRHPLVPILASVPLAPVAAVYVVWCWARVGILAPLLQLPLVLAARFAYGFATVIGGTRWWLGARQESEFRPRWE